MVKTMDAIRTARNLIGTPYSELDCIGLIVRVIRMAPGGVTTYRTAGTNTLWRSAEASAKYRDLTWRQETSSALRAPSPEGKAGLVGARAGMLAFKRRGTDVYHVGIVAERPLCGMQRGRDRESQGAEGDYASSPGGNQLTVIHSSSAAGKVMETKLDDTWQLLAVHRYIEVKNSLSLPAADSSLRREPMGNELPQPAAPAAPSGGSLGDETEDTRMEAYKMKVVASSLNVRDEPDVKGKRIGRLNEGAIVTVQASFADGWKYVTYGDGALGYVDGSYLAEYVEPAAAEAPKITIIDSANNHFVPVGDFRVIVGSVD